jgi:gamma-glutamyl:cysteine ligase YbdK (ATP-grasp superfamily)
MLRIAIVDKLRRLVLLALAAAAPIVDGRRRGRASALARTRGCRAIVAEIDVSEK